MSDTVVSLLTPPGTGAIATVEVRGPQAWELARKLFKPAGKPLPEVPEVNRFWFGTLGSDEVILAVAALDAIEVHSHGGRRVVRWVIDQFTASGGRQPPVQIESDENRGLTPPARLLERASTLRTASILLDQIHGAFANEVRLILTLLKTHPPAAQEPLRRLSELGNTVGRHLIEPWKVVIAGPPNVGKSSLVNALAGYQRAVVSEVAGTTRDAVSVRTAFDGWPVELIDTAGLRDATGVEATGIELARNALQSADRLVWVVDATAPHAHLPDLGSEFPTAEPLVVANKCDLPHACDVKAMAVSAKTGAGIAELARAIVAGIPGVPPGTAVPYGPQLIELVNNAARAAQGEMWSEAATLLRAALDEV